MKSIERAVCALPVLNIQFHKLTPSFYDGLDNVVPFFTSVFTMLPTLEFEDFFMHASAIGTGFRRTNVVAIFL